MATPDAKATVGSHSRWLPYGGQQGATTLRPSTPPESGEPLEDLTDGAARSRSIEESGNDISGRQVWTELA